MSIEPEAPTAVQQRRQAGKLLLRLQWLLVLVLIVALVWLYISQQRFQNQVNERFQSTEQVVTRLNEIDDRLFANTQPALPQAKGTTGNQAQNQLDLLRIQIQATDSLLANNHIKAAIDLLRGLHWQLSQKSNEIAPALTIIIQKGLNEDIERLQALSAQPSPWQLQNLAIQDIQAFLHSYERNNSENKVHNQNALLTRQQLTIHEVIMTLNLAIQASNMRERDQLISYLSQARTQLQTLTSTPPPSKQKATVADKATEDIKKTDSADRLDADGSNAAGLDNMPAPTNMAEVIAWLDQLIANAPTPTPLVSAQIVEHSSGQNKP